MSENELIEALRERAVSDSPAHTLMREAADVLEAAAGVQGEPNDELIAEAQQHYSEMNGLNSRAAEVMMELVAALEAKTGVRVDMSSAVGVEAQLAATSVPVQGEPNDDREVLDNVLIDAREAGDGLSAVRNRILAAGFSRATVPDAATAALKREAAVIELRKRYGVSNGTQTWIEFHGDPHFIVNQVLAALDWAPDMEYTITRKITDPYETVHFIGKYDEDNYLEE